MSQLPNDPRWCPGVGSLWNTKSIQTRGVKNSFFWQLSDTIHNSFSVLQLHDDNLTSFWRCEAVPIWAPTSWWHSDGILTMSSSRSLSSNVMTTFWWAFNGYYYNIFSYFKKGTSDRPLDDNLTSSTKTSKSQYFSNWKTRYKNKGCNGSSNNDPNTQ